MCPEESSLKKKFKLFRGLLAEEQDSDEDKAKMKLVEVVKVRRVVKRGEKAVRHGSEMLEREKVSDRDLEITRKVVEQVAHPQVPVTPENKAQRRDMFKCLECGALVPTDSVRCPRCEVLYVSDPTNSAMDEEDEYEEVSVKTDGGPDLIGEDSASFVHFCPINGEVTCLENEEGEADFGLECQSCGTVTQLGVERCPICGHDFEEEDTGLMHLLEGLKFDLDEDKELDCPACGEHVVVKDTVCPACNEPICYRFSRSREVAVVPALKEKDILFVHLDVMNGDLHFAKKVRFRKTSTVESVHLESITKDAFEHDWHSLARI